MFGFLILGALAVSSANAVDTSKPNIVWVVVEDMSAHFGCYGEKAITTPNLDLMASKGTRFPTLCHRPHLLNLSQRNDHRYVSNFYRWATSSQWQGLT